MNENFIKEYLKIILEASKNDDEISDDRYVSSKNVNYIQLDISSTPPEGDIGKKIFNSERRPKLKSILKDFSGKIPYKGIDKWLTNFVYELEDFLTNIKNIPNQQTVKTELNDDQSKNKAKTNVESK